MKGIKYILCLSLIALACSCSLLRNKSNEENSDLTRYYKSWLGTKYLAGGTTKDGVDCSGFVQNVYKDVYGISLPRRSADMEKAVVSVDNRGNLREGDLVFFNNTQGVVNHVGIYLNNDNFVHSSTSRGVMVSNLNDKYWKDVFYHGGHHPQMKNKKMAKAKPQIKKSEPQKPKKTKEKSKTKEADFEVEFPES